MTNLEKYKQAFVDAFDVEMGDVESLTFQGIPAWDSVGHMELIANIEDAFDIMFDTDDIVDFSSYEKGLEFLRKYEVEI